MEKKITKKKKNHKTYLLSMHRMLMKGIDSMGFSTPSFDINIDLQHYRMINYK